ncbi:8-oxoguanine glycosylase ogg1 [Phytophthora pseudosyringae]|uniref:8-oxoguanine glycosylase ogg1 n=1 Tax=Phytophthora pseudosyringae TaxID=221518 RepID=A0A8T1VUJ1_9STRA|nr:8-oxoguanine glycosylase ogg1 [Phytophthora pseudosyringae]
MVKLLCVLAFFLFASAPVSTADESLRAPRRLQTYAQASDYVGLMLERVNLERAAQHLPALCTNSKLQAAAQRHSDDQAANNFMDHAGSDGSSMSQRVTDAGYDWRGVAENVAAGQIDVAEVMDAWMNSEGHRHNILGDFTMLGTAYAHTSDGLYNHFWTQDFGRSDVEQCDDGSVPAASTSPTSPTSSSNSAQTSSSQPSSSNSSGSGDNTMSAPNGRDSRDTSSSSTFISPTTPLLLVVAVATVTGLSSPWA